MAYEHERAFEKTVLAQIGTLIGDGTIYWKAPFAFTLLQVQGVQSNAGKAKVKVGNGTDAEYYVAQFALGESGTPTVKDAGDWNTTYTATGNPRIAAGTVMIFTIDYDGVSSTAGADPHISIAGLIG